MTQEDQMRPQGGENAMGNKVSGVRGRRYPAAVCGPRARHRIRGAPSAEEHHWEEAEVAGPDGSTRWPGTAPNLVSTRRRGVETCGSRNVEGRRDLAGLGAGMELQRREDVLRLGGAGLAEETRRRAVLVAEEGDCSEAEERTKLLQGGRPWHP